MSEPIVMRLHGNAVRANRKKLEATIRRMSLTIADDQPIEFVVPAEDSGEAAQTKRGGVDGG